MRAAPSTEVRRGLRVLDLGHYERDEASHRNDCVRRLEQASAVGDKGVKALAEAPHLAGLEALYLNGCAVSPPVPASSPTPPR